MSPRAARFSLKARVLTRLGLSVKVSAREWIRCSCGGSGRCEILYLANVKISTYTSFAESISASRNIYPIFFFFVFFQVFFCDSFLAQQIPTYPSDSNSFGEQGLWKTSIAMWAKHCSRGSAPLSKGQSRRTSPRVTGWSAFACRKLTRKIKGWGGFVFSRSTYL